MASINKRTVRWKTRHGEPRSAARYEATYHDRNGKRHRGTLVLKRDAQRWLDEQTTGLVTGQWADACAGKETFQAYAKRWRTRQVHAPTTQDAFERILRMHVYPPIGGNAPGRSGTRRHPGTRHTLVGLRSTDDRRDPLHDHGDRLPGCGPRPDPPRLAVHRRLTTTHRAQVGPRAPSRPKPCCGSTMRPEDPGVGPHDRRRRLRARCCRRSQRLAPGLGHPPGRSTPGPLPTTRVTTSPASRSPAGARSRISSRCWATSRQPRPGTPTGTSSETRTTTAGQSSSVHSGRRSRGCSSPATWAADRVASGRFAPCNDSPSEITATVVPQ